MIKLKTSMLFSMTMLVAAAPLTSGSAGETTYSVTEDNVIQISPPDAMTSRQVIIIDSDRFGNQRKLTIGSAGGGLKPCSKTKPVAGMNCAGKDLEGIDWKGIKLDNGIFEEAKLAGAVLQGAKLTNTSFSNAKLAQADLSGAILVNSDFENADLTGARFARADLTNADFAEARLRGVDFTGADMTNTDFDGADLSGAIWSDGRTCLNGSVGSCKRN